MVALLRRWRHRLAHWAGWNLGQVETWYDGDRLMVGFRCECGDLTGVHEVPRNLDPWGMA